MSTGWKRSWANASRVESVIKVAEESITGVPSVWFIALLTRAKKPSTAKFNFPDGIQPLGQGLDLGSVLSISLADEALGWQFSPSLSLTDHVSPTAPLTSSPQLRLSLTAHLSLGEQNKPGPSQLSQISQLLQISQNFNHYKYKKHLNYQQYHNSITCHKKTHLLQLSHK